MKPNIHPKWYPEAQVTCACGHTWKVGATIETIRTDVCSKCHPFFTGEQRIVDTEGQVERFVRRLEQAVGDQARTKRQKAAQRKQRRAIVELVDEAEA